MKTRETLTDADEQASNERRCLLTEKGVFDRYVPSIVAACQLDDGVRKRLKRK